MKVNYQNNRDTNFKGFYNNKALKKGLEFAANNGTLFAATTSLALSTIRPITVLSTPKTDKTTKNTICAKSITSTITGYLIAVVCSLPIANSIKKIDNNPEKYLNKDTITALKESGKTLKESKAYSMATQLFKLGLGCLIAAPKAILTALGTPYILDLFNKNNNDYKLATENPNGLIFKGKDKIAKGIGKSLNNKNLQNFVNKNKDSNFPLHVIAITDTIATGAYIHQTQKSKKLKNEEKKSLIYNSIISTTLSIASTYIIDRITKKHSNKFIEKYKKINFNDPNLAKQIEGIRIAKPILIAGCVYYIAIPLISTFLAGRINYKKDH